MKIYLKYIVLVLTISVPLTLLAQSLTSNPYADILKQKLVAEQRELEAIQRWTELTKQIDPLLKAQASYHETAQQARKDQASLAEKARSLAAGNTTTQPIPPTFTQPSE